MFTSSAHHVHRWCQLMFWLRCNEIQPGDTVWQQLLLPSPIHYTWYENSKCPHVFISPLWKSESYIGFALKKWGLYWMLVVCHSVHHNSVPLNILRTKWQNFTNFLYMHSYWQDLAWDFYMSFFALLYQSHDPWFTSKFLFRSISWEQNYGQKVHQILYKHSYWQDLAWDC